MVRFVLAALVALYLALPAAGAAPAGAYTRTHSGGGVEVRATYAPPEYFAAANDPQGLARFEAGRQVVFLVSMDTHAGDLARFDAVANSRLRTSAGGDHAPAKWVPITDGGHHRSGALVFAAGGGRATVIGPGVASITLTISNLAGVPARAFTWALPIR